MSDNEAKEKLVDLVVENVKDKSLRNELLYYIFNGHTSSQQHLTPEYTYRSVPGIDLSKGPQCNIAPVGIAQG